MLAVDPIDAPCGATVSNIDLSSSISDEIVAELRQAWLQHHVLVFPNQVLSAADIERFTLSFGRGPTRGIEHRTPTAGCCRGGPPSGDKCTAPVPGRAIPWAAGASYGRAGSPEMAAKRRREARGPHF